MIPLSVLIGRFVLRAKAYRWRRSAKSVDYRRTDAVYEHPLYDRTKRVADLCLIRVRTRHCAEPVRLPPRQLSFLQLIRPFRQVDGYAKLVGSRAMFDGDVELKCTVAGIGIPLHGPGNSYAVPVWVKYGRSACRIPKLKSVALIFNTRTALLKATRRSGSRD